MSNKNIGGIWKKEKNGREFLSISIEINGEKLSFVAFRNDYKTEGDSAPDYRILPPREAQSKPAAQKPPVGEGEIPW